MREFQGETAHGFQAGCAITLALTASKLADIMKHVGWDREHTARYSKVLNPEGCAGLMTGIAKSAGKGEKGGKGEVDFEAMNELKRLLPQHSI